MPTVLVWVRGYALDTLPLDEPYGQLEAASQPSGLVFGLWEEPRLPEEKPGMGNQTNNLLIVRLQLLRLQAAGFFSYSLAFASYCIV